MSTTMITTTTTTTSDDVSRIPSTDIFLKKIKKFYSICCTLIYMTQEGPLFLFFLDSRWRVKMMLICILPFGLILKLFTKLYSKLTQNNSDMFCNFTMFNISLIYSPSWKINGAKFFLRSFLYRLIVAHPSIVQRPDRKISDGMIGLT